MTPVELRSNKKRKITKTNELRVKHLKRLLRERGLSTSGSREDLILRLIEHENTDEIEFVTTAQLQLEMNDLREYMQR